MHTSKDEGERLVGDDGQEGVDVDSETAVTRHGRVGVDVDVIHLRVVAVVLQIPAVPHSIAAHTVHA